MNKFRLMSVFVVLAILFGFANVSAGAAVINDQALSAVPGPIVAWGDNSFGQLSDAPPGNDFIAIAGGEGTGYALRTDGSIAAWGNDAFGQVSNAPTETGFTAIAANWWGKHAYALRTDGSIAAWGNNSFGQVSNTPTGTGFTAITSGFEWGSALRADGSIVAWGRNSYGVLNVPAGTGFTAIRGAVYNGFALRADGSLAYWGTNASGMFTGVPTGTGFTQVSLSFYAGTALAPDGSIAPWGGNTWGETSGAPAGTGFTTIAHDQRTGFALRADGSIAAWGNNPNGIVSNAPTRTGFTALAGAGNSVFAISSTPVYRPEISVRQLVGTNLIDRAGTPNSQYAKSVNFGSVAAGSTSAPATITIVNSGTSDLTGLALTTGGLNPADFIVSPLGATTLAPGTSTTFDVTYIPPTSATSFMNIQIASNDANENPFDIVIVGNGSFSVVYGTGAIGDAVHLFDFGYDGFTMGGKVHSPSGAPDLFFRAGSSPIFPGVLDTYVQFAVNWDFEFGRPTPYEGSVDGDDNWMKVIRDGDGCVSWAQFDFNFTDPSQPVLTAIPLYVTRTDCEDFTLAEAVAAAAASTPPNAPPSAVSGGPYLVTVSQQIIFDGSGSTDPDNDPLAETWTADGGTVYGNAYAAGSVPGIYNVRLIVNDGKVDSQPDATIVVVYDPSGGFVTGGGWIDSPAGAYSADPSLTGKANFGFVTRYKQGANVPDGNTQFQFKAGDLNFQSNSYEWLVVAGNKAQFKGEGSINGQGSYKFMITADDDSLDTFRIKIWYEENVGEIVVYDNGSQQTLGGGSIVIHK